MAKAGGPDLQITVGEKKVDCCINHPSDTSSKSMALILTHGAGGDMNLPQLVVIATEMANRGFTCIRFNCKGPIVHRCKIYNGVLEYVYNQRDKIGVTSAVLAGRSMGSRAALMVLNELPKDSAMSGFVKGAVGISYPLHPPGDRANLRDAPLIAMDRPCILINGSKDTMCDKELLDKTLSKAVARSGESMIKMHWMEGGDHGLTGKGRDNVNIIYTVISHITDFCSGLGEKSGRLTSATGNTRNKKRSSSDNSTESKKKKTS